MTDEKPDTPDGEGAGVPPLFPEAAPLEPEGPEIAEQGSLFEDETEASGRLLDLAPPIGAPYRDEVAPTPPPRYGETQPQFDFAPADPNSPPRFHEAFEAAARARPAAPPPTEEHRNPKGDGAKKTGLLATLGLLALKAKSVLLGAKSLFVFLKMGKFLTTGGTMLLSVWFYAVRFGWPFGVGLVLSIFVHEMGHVYVAWRQGVPITAPIFLPGFGALIIQKRSAKSAWGEALIGIGGPVGGTLGALACWAVYATTGNDFWLGLAYFGFLINLFNLIPMFPLDGGWIVAAISPWLWLAGLAAMTTLFAMGWIRNPFVILLLIVSIPTVWRGLKHKGEYIPGLLPATSGQRWVMGLCYVGLTAGLLWAMGHTHVVHW